MPYSVRSSLACGLDPGLQIFKFPAEFLLPPREIPGVQDEDHPHKAVRKEKIDI
jgi:hypothetical protein